MRTPGVMLSIVTSMYRSAPYLQEFYDRCSVAARQLTDSYEFVFVNDGSPDESLQIALQLRERDPRVRVVDLSRNFGHHKALMTGLARARGERVFLLDCDLEEDPAWLLAFHQNMRRRTSSPARVAHWSSMTRRLPNGLRSCGRKGPIGHASCEARSTSTPGSTLARHSCRAN